MCGVESRTGDFCSNLKVRPTFFFLSTFTVLGVTRHVVIKS